MVHWDSLLLVIFDGTDTVEAAVIVIASGMLLGAAGRNCGLHWRVSGCSVVTSLSAIALLRVPLSIAS